MSACGDWLYFPFRKHAHLHQMQFLLCVLLWITATSQLAYEDSETYCKNLYKISTWST